MIADDGLDDGEAEAGAELFGGVVRRKEARAFFGREALAGVGDFDAHIIAGVGSAQSERAAGGHGVQRIEDEILKSAVEKIGIGVDFRQRFREERFRGDGGFADGGKLRFEQTHGVAKRFVYIDASELRRGHFGEIAEAADDAVEIGEFGFERGGAFGKNFLKLRGAEGAGALQVFKSDLHGE